MHIYKQKNKKTKKTTTAAGKKIMRVKIKRWGRLIFFFLKKRGETENEQKLSNWPSERCFRSAASGKF